MYSKYAIVSLAAALMLTAAPMTANASPTSVSENSNDSSTLNEMSNKAHSAASSVKKNVNKAADNANEAVNDAVRSADDAVENANQPSDNAATAAAGRESSNIADTQEDEILQMLDEWSEDIGQKTSDVRQQLTDLAPMFKSAFANQVYSNVSDKAKEAQEKVMAKASEAKEKVKDAFTSDGNSKGSKDDNQGDSEMSGPSKEEIDEWVSLQEGDKQAFRAYNDAADLVTDYRGIVMHYESATSTRLDPRLRIIDNIDDGDKLTQKAQIGKSYATIKSSSKAWKTKLEGHRKTLNALEDALEHLTDGLPDNMRSAFARLSNTRAWSRSIRTAGQNLVNPTPST